MVSLANSSLSGDISNKRTLENVFAPKYKPRKVNAQRKFPPRCGRNAFSKKWEQEEDGRDRIGQASEFRNSETRTTATDDAGISRMPVEFEALGNSEMANGVEDDGVKTAGVINSSMLHDANISELQNVVCCGGVRSSNMEVDFPSDEAVYYDADADADADTNGIKMLMVESGLPEVQLQNDVECHGQKIINNPIVMEMTESLDALAGKVKMSVMDGSANDFEELITETKLNTVDKLNNMKCDSSNQDTEVGNQTSLADGKKVVEELKSQLCTGASVDKEVMLRNSLSLPSVCGNMPVQSTRLRDKYRHRRVSANRIFPPHCGRNISLPVEEEKLIGISGNDCPDLVAKVEVESEVKGHMLTSEEVCLDGFGVIYVKNETPEALSDYAGKGALREVLEATMENGLVFDECNRHLQENNRTETEAREGLRTSVAMSKASAGVIIGDIVGSKRKEMVVYLPGQKDDLIPPSNDFILKNGMHSEVVQGLMAAPYCPWRKGKLSVSNSDDGTSGLNAEQSNMQRLLKTRTSTLNSELKAGKGVAFNSYDTNGIPGALTFNEGEDYGSYNQTALEITPISSYKPVLNNNGNYSTKPVVEDAVYSPRGSEEVPSLHFIPTDEVDREIVHGLMAKAYCPWRKGKRVAKKSNGKMNREKGREQFLGFKAVARKSSQQSVSLILPSKKHREVRYPNDADLSARALALSDDGSPRHDEEIPSASRCKPKYFEVSLPPFGPSSSGHGDARNKVRESLRLFQAICRKLLHEEESNLMPKDKTKSKKPGKKPRRIDLEASKIIKDMGKEVNVDKQILGEIPGVEVGDEFQYRVELTFVGIHRLYQGGIDSMKFKGVRVATSIVSSGAYADDFENSDVLIYCGQGGNVVEKSKTPEDQKLEKGNLALRNSISAQTPVRVIRGWKEPKASSDPLDTKPKLFSTYVYDGLYTVKNYWTEKGPHGKNVFMFELRRNPGQPELAWKQLKKPNKSKFRPGVCFQDISGGQEHFPISAVNILDNQKPPPFNYISKMKYPDWFRPIPLAGCDCTGRCSDSKRCRCAVRNGGEIPYNRNGALVETKPLVYECGPHCRCPPSCYNRVSQSGIKFQLEIFKTECRGWGVRALNSIPSGSFICEYVGELLEDKEAERRVGNDEYLFDIGRIYHDSEESSFTDPKVEGGYTIDAAGYGNVGRFVNHCCLPNLYAQNVIYDHNDTRMPHIMLFALENIPPLQELTYDYNYSMGQIEDTDGNIKVKKCYCGAAQCTGRLY